MVLAISLPVLLLLLINEFLPTRITDLKKYPDVIGINAKGVYKDKWGMSEAIFPASVDALNVAEFKSIHTDWMERQFLAYLVVDYDADSYEKEMQRLKIYEQSSYAGYFSTTGFSDYEPAAIHANKNYGFVYALTDGKSRIIYVELIFPQVMDIDYNKEIPKEYLPDGFNPKP